MHSNTDGHSQSRLTICRRSIEPARVWRENTGLRSKITSGTDDADSKLQADMLDSPPARQRGSCPGNRR